MKMKSLLLVTLATLGLTASTMAQNFPNYVPANGLVGWWPFNGNANDESGNGNNGNVNGAILTNDRFGNSNKAYSFDGINDFIDCGNISSLNNSNNLSISAWFNYNQILTGARIIGAEFVQNSNLGWGLSLDNFFTTGNSIKGIIRNSDQPGGTAQIGFTNNNLQPDTIFHAVMVFDGNQNFNSEKLRIYVDGVLQSLTYGDSIPSTLPETNFNTIIGGIDGSITNSAFDGTLDDIGIWNRALTAEEVQQLYTLNACTFTIYDTVTVNNYVTVFDTVLVSITDTLIINTLITAVQPAQENTLLVYPNPANSHITIDYGNFVIMNGYQLKIENSIGQQVFQTNINQQTDYLSLNNWGGNGLYFVHIIDAQGNTIDIRKIVLQ